MFGMQLMDKLSRGSLMFKILDHTLDLWREVLPWLVAVAYSSSGSHCSGWKSGLRK
jgi:hypothetical protein